LLDSWRRLHHRPVAAASAAACHKLRTRVDCETLSDSKSTRVIDS